MKLADGEVLFQPWETELSAHQRESYSVTLLAREPRKFVLKPIGTVEGGWLWRMWDQSPITVTEGCEVEVWAPIDRNPELKVVGPTANTSMLQMTFKHGMPPENLAYHCDIDLPADWRIDANQIVGAKIAFGNDTATIQWSARSMQKSSQSFLITVYHPTAKGDIITTLKPELFVEPQSN